MSNIARPLHHMNKKYKLYQVDAFTRTRFSGNPAGVVPDAEGLTDKQMQAIARELNNSETAFILPADGTDHDVRVRFFTPTTEVPTCGHATIAAHYVRAIEYQLPACTVLQKIGIGTLPVEVTRHGTDYHIVMTQCNVEFLGEMNSKEREILLSALDLHENDLDNRCPIQHVSTGSSKIIVGVKSRAKLDSLMPDRNVLMEINQTVSNKGYFLFTLDSDDPDILTHARMFAPQIGIDEDPVTGNGNGPLGAYLVKNKLFQYNGTLFEFKSQQGEAIGRPGIAHVSVEIEEDKPTRIRVGGDAVIAFKTEIEM